MYGIMGKKEAIKEMILNDKQFEKFVQSDAGCIEYKVCGIPIFIVKEEQGGRFYYQLPYNEEYDYNQVTEFMQVAIPTISDLIEKERAKKLQG